MRHELEVIFCLTKSRTLIKNISFEKYWLGGLKAGGKHRRLIPWHWQERYRISIPEGFEPTDDELKLSKAYGIDYAQINWLRSKKEGQSFREEYPITFGEKIIAPWERGKQRETPCCHCQAFLLDNTQSDNPYYSRWECEKCHTIWCWASMIEVKDVP